MRVTSLALFVYSVVCYVNAKQEVRLCYVCLVEDVLRLELVWLILVIDMNT